jgi:hypothetical protein
MKNHFHFFEHFVNRVTVFNSIISKTKNTNLRANFFNNVIQQSSFLVEDTLLINLVAYLLANNHPT